MNYALKHDYISDTITCPTKDMIDYAMTFAYGDCGYDEDDATNLLEDKLSQLFGFESCIFTLSGMASNILAINSVLPAGTSLIVPSSSDLFLWESSSLSYIGGYRLSPRPVLDGKFDLQASYWKTTSNTDFGQISPIGGVAIEDPHILSGGSYLGLDYIDSLFTLCKSLNLPLHIDGARLLNAIALDLYIPSKLGQSCTTLSMCFSKTLGAPMGSVLLGSKSIIKKAKYFRKLIGGTVRQGGLVASMCLYALNNMRNTVSHSVSIAKELHSILIQNGFDEAKHLPSSNIILLRLENGNNEFISHMHSHNIRVSGLEPGTIRIVTHLHHDSESLDSFKLALSNAPH